MVRVRVMLMVMLLQQCNQNDNNCCGETLFSTDVSCNALTNTTVTATADTTTTAIQCHDNSEELKSHFQSMNCNAEDQFVHDYWDTLEEFLDSLGGGGGGGGGARASEEEGDLSHGDQGRRLLQVRCVGHD